VPLCDEVEFESTWKDVVEDETEAEEVTAEGETATRKIPAAAAATMTTPNDNAAPCDKAVRFPPQENFFTEVKKRLE
jgi:hypothetical protein